MRTRVRLTAPAAGCNFAYVYTFIILVLVVLHLGAGVQVEGTTTSSLGLLGTFGTSDAGLTSPGGVFKFGFFKSTSSGSSEQYALAIWYAQLPTSVRTIVWIAARDISLSSSASLQVSQNGVLQLLDSTQSQQPLWQSVNRPLNATGVELRDSGNLVLVDATNATVWQSFDTPTDTLLPGQNFSETMNLSLSAWKESNDWSDGYYQAGWVTLNNSANFALSWTGKSIANWNTSSWSTNYTQVGNNTIYPYQFTSPASYIVLDESSGSFYIGNNSVPAIGNTSEQAPGVLRRVTLDSDGGLRMWRWQSTVWNEEGNWVSDSCQTFAICGPYGICGHDPVYPTTPSCTCPTSSSFTWIDASNHFKGCKPVTTIPDNKCSLNTSEFQMLKAGEIDYPFADRIMDPFNTDEENCKATCLQDCKCAGAVHWRRDGRCYIKKFPLFNGGYPTQVGNRSAFVKVLIAGASPPSSSSAQVSLVAGLSVAAAALAVLIAGLLVMLYVRRRRRRQGRATLSLHLLTGPRKFTYRELSLATKSFAESERVGSGGMGAVYKGILRKSGSMVAVKRIRHESQDGEDGFLAEASSISQIRHRNLVQLQGWCHEDNKLMLVYDYMPNGSLDQWLYGKAGQGKVKHRCSELLSWERRYSILRGVAAALAYLHEDWQQCVLHRDIKSSNVMLDAEFNAHLGDFGLARLIDHQKVEKTTLMAGTLGYMAPEMPYTGKATKESDVYSFGILMLEVVSGRKPVDHSGSDVDSENVLLLNRVWRAYESGNLLSVVDPLLKFSGSGHHHHKSQLTASGESFQLVEISYLSDKGSGRAVDHDFSLALTRRVEEEILSEKEQKLMVLKMGLLCCLSNPTARPSIRLIHQIFMSGDISALPPLPAKNSLESTASVLLGINSGFHLSNNYQQPFPFASELHHDSVSDSQLSRYTSTEASQ